jgi:hypothetical protein
MKTLEGIGNTLATFIKVSEVTKMDKYTSYERTCIHM